MPNLTKHEIVLEIFRKTGFPQKQIIDNVQQTLDTIQRALAEVIAKSKKERAEIDADAEVSVRRAAMEASRRKLQIDLEEQAAQIAQVQQLETLKAAQLSEVVQRKADSELASARARIEMEQRIRSADLERERTIREAQSELAAVEAALSTEGAPS